MLQGDTPSPRLLIEVRAALVGAGTSLNAVCRAEGLHRQAVAAALSGKRNGPKSQALAAEFLNHVRRLQDAFSNAD